MAYLIERRRDLGKSHGGIVLIGGDAGIGKSRLVCELLERTGARRGRAAVGRCRPFASAPYEPLLEVLALLAPAAKSLVPAATRAAQLRSLADAFLSAAEKQAILGIIEDLHWSDAGTLDVLALLAERLSTSRVLLVATYRANELGPEHPHYIAFGALTRSRSVASITLGPLSIHNAREFIDATLRDNPGDVSADTRRTIAHVAEGNPFFTEELLKAAVDREQLHQAERSLPTSVRAAILERLRPLATRDRAILTQAALIGRRFDVNLLAATLDTDVARVLTMLQRARSLQIIEESDDANVFRFRHALTREAMYDGLLPAQRRPLHRAIAIALEAQTTQDGPAEALSYHWWAAGDPVKALEYGERCGDAAQSLHGYADAIESYERTISLLDPLGRDAARVRAKIAISFFRSGVMDRAIEYFQAAWDFHERSPGDPASSLRLARFLAAALYNDGRIGESTEFLRAAVETIARSGDSRTSECARVTFAAYLVDAGELEETRGILNGIAPDRIALDAGLAIAFWQTSCKLHALEGDVAGVRDAAGHICNIGEHPGDAPVLIEGLAEAGMSALSIGETDVARRCFGRAIDACVSLKLSASHGDVLVESALERVLSGAFEEARTLVRSAFSLIGEGRLGRQRAVLAALAVGTALEDRELLAYEPGAASLDRVFETGLPLLYAPYAALCAPLLARRGDVGGAQRVLRRALRAACTVRMPFATFPLVVVAAQHCDRADFADVRKLCALTATGGPASFHAATLAQAIMLRRAGELETSKIEALRAAAGFGAIGWPVYEALALEYAGERSTAKRLFERIGYRGRSLFPEPAACVESLEPALSPRELEIARHVSSGRTNREIATALNVSIKLVEKNVSSIYAKLAVSSRSQLTAHMIGRNLARRGPSSL